MKKLAIKDFVTAVDYELADTFHHQWKCYGEDAYSIRWEESFELKERTAFVSASIVYDAKDRTVYEMDLWDERDDSVWRWINPDFVNAVKKEYKSRDLDFRLAIDKIKYVYVTPGRILGKLKRLHGESHLGRRRKRAVRV
jgi:hypothetical protein